MTILDQTPMIYLCIQIQGSVSDAQIIVVGEIFVKDNTVCLTHSTPADDIISTNLGNLRSG
jgi:hypothetical protein